MKNLLTAATLTLAASLFSAAALPRVAAADEAPANRVTILEIQGMATPTCPALVKAAVSKIPGVVKVDASLETMTARVEYRSGSTTPEHIRKVIKDQVGFESKVR